MSAGYAYNQYRRKRKNMVAMEQSLTQYQQRVMTFHEAAGTTVIIVNDSRRII